MKKDMLKKQKGQLIIEAMLIMMLALAAGVLIKKRFADKNFIGALVAGPWGQISGMASNGNWKKVEEGKSLHPMGKVTSREGDVQ